MNAFCFFYSVSKFYMTMNVKRCFLYQGNFKILVLLNLDRKWDNS